MGCTASLSRLRFSPHRLVCQNLLNLAITVEDRGRSPVCFLSIVAPNCAKVKYLLKRSCWPSVVFGTTPVKSVCVSWVGWQASSGHTVVAQVAPGFRKANYLLYCGCAADILDLRWPSCRFRVCELGGAGPPRAALFKLNLRPPQDPPR